MKLHSIALAALAAACAGAAHAAPAVDPNGPDTVRIFMSGASALRNTISGLIFNDVCGGLSNASSTVYNMTLPAVAGGAPAPSTNFWAIACTLPDAFNGIPAGTNVAFFKSDNGGSGQGVFPVYFETARNFVDAAPGACTTTGTADREYRGCTANRLEVPMFGVSDVEPGLFTGFNVPTDDLSYPAGGLTPSQLAELHIETVVQTVFGVAVNKGLYEEMQRAQGIANVGSTAEADQPSIGKAIAASYFAGILGAPSGGLGWQPLVRADDPKAGTQVNVCRRVNGSGTQAAANRHLLEYPCSGAAALAPADNSYSNPARANTLAGVVADGETFVYEGAGTGDVVNCLNAAETNGAYAIGHVSKENAPGSNNWRHVKLDGVSPNRDNVKRGLYDYTFESTLQYKNARFATLTPSQQSFISGFLAEAPKPSSLAKLGSAAQEGVAALPTSYSGPFGTGTPDEIKFGSRVSRNGNSCSPVTVFK